MKFLETKFEDYIHKCEKYNIHKKMDNILNIYDSLDNLNNLIFYGPSGVGKYTQMLKFIKKFSTSDLKYERKITYKYNNKYEYTFKISDIHFEIDMDLLGCNSKLLFNELYYHIIDVCKSNGTKINIIVCKNFHKVHPELLENFYSYMQSIEHKNLIFKFILLTEQVSFIPKNILNRCQILSFPKPTITNYKKLNKSSENLTEFNNLKDCICSLDKNIAYGDKKIVNVLLNMIINYKDIDYLLFRESCYDIFIYCLDLNEVIYTIISKLVEQKYLDKENVHDILLDYYHFLKYYNNNYRPIYHLEKFFYKMILCLKN
tara:strand:- start:1587 stop:2537 length:951 start_codon:yes stop_codon:yes gene_type:complete